MKAKLDLELCSSTSSTSKCNWRSLCFRHSVLTRPISRFLLGWKQSMSCIWTLASTTSFSKRDCWNGFKETNTGFQATFLRVKANKVTENNYWWVKAILGSKKFTSGLKNVLRKFMSSTGSFYSSQTALLNPKKTKAALGKLWEYVCSRNGWESLGSTTQGCLNLTESMSNH